MTPETAMLSPDRLPDLSTLMRANDDYAVVRRAIAYISEHWRAQPEVEQVAHAVGVTPDELHHLFRRWAGLTPKAFLQAITLDAARKLLRDSASVLDATYEVGLSGPGRLHDLFVTHEAMSPGEWKSGGEGLTISYGFHPSPFGIALVMATPRGLAGLAFGDPGEEKDDARRYDAALGEGELRRGHVDHRAARCAHLRCEAVAPGPAAAHHHDRHRLRGARVGDTARHSDGQVLDLFGHRQQDRPARRPRVRWVPRSARTRCRSWCRAIACSAAPAISRAITGG